MNAQNDLETARVFAYHEIASANVNDVYCITPDIFLQHLWAMRSAKGQSGCPLVVSFDDGHESNHRWAAPILEEMALRGHFFIPSTWVGNRSGFMQWHDLRSLVANGHTVGSHSATHAFLPHCGALRLYEELAGSRLDLEDHLGVDVTSISMPGGRWNQEVLRACSMAGYKTVYTSEPGYYRPSMLQGEIEMPAVIGRFAVQRRTSLSAITGYATGDRMTTRRLQSMYQLRRGIKRLLGDQGYQRLWSHFFRAVPSS